MFNSLVVRAKGRVVEGYAMVWHKPGDKGTEYPHPDGFVERISREAGESILDPGIILTWEHKLENYLGRYPKALTLEVDDTGLLYRCEVPNSRAGRALLGKLESGQIKGSSFVADIDPSSVQYSREGDRDILTITRFNELVEVSAVERPCYQKTHSEIMRGLLPIDDETKRRMREARQLLKINL